jgi:DNA-binding CsgD family transcriptional regulator
MSTPRRGRGRGGRGGHEPRLRIQAREQRAYELSIQGKSQTEIATALEISQPAVSKLLRRVEDRLVTEMAADVRRLRVRLTAQLLHVYQEAMQAFERSKAPTNHRRQRKMLGAGQDGSSVAELVTHEGCGDPRHLEVARRAVVDLWRLAGLDTVPLTDIASPPSLAHMSSEELNARLRQMVTMFIAEDTCANLAPAPSTGEAALPRPLTAAQAYEEAYGEELARRARVWVSNC